MEELAKGGEYLLTFSKRAEGLCTLQREDDDDECGGAAVGETLFGESAMKLRFSRCVKTGIAETEDLREFRAFRWLLKEKENAQFVEWEGSAVQQARTRMKEQKAKAILDIEKSQKKKKDEAGPSQSQIVPAPPLRATKRKKIAEDDKTESKLEPMPIADDPELDT